LALRNYIKGSLRELRVSLGGWVLHGLLVALGGRDRKMPQGFRAASGGLDDHWWSKVGWGFVGAIRGFQVASGVTSGPGGYG
jgi:hypothetical protein